MSKYGRLLQMWLQRLVTSLLVVWLAVFAPATCLYHGFLLTPTATTSMISLPPQHDHPMEHHGHHGQHSVQTSQAADDNSTPLGPLFQHKTLAGESSTMLLLAIALPAEFSLPLLAPSFDESMAQLIALLVMLPPPDQPPRLPSLAT
jgi:hypothetical protein